jgi:hypothetical protein
LFEPTSELVVNYKWLRKAFTTFLSSKNKQQNENSITFFFAVVAVQNKRKQKIIY